MSDQIPASANPAASEVSTDPSNQNQDGVDKQGNQVPDEPWRKVKHKYKAAGKDVEVDYDELIKRAQKADGADARFQDAAAKEKAAAERFAKLKDPNNEDWDELIQSIGYEKAKKFADKLVWDQIEWDQLSPEQKELLKAQKERDQFKSDLDKHKETQAQAEKQKLQTQALSIIQKELDDVLKLAKAEGLPVTDIPEIEELICMEMADYLEWMDREEKAGRKITTPPPSHEDVLRKIQERYDQRSDVYLKRLSVDQLKGLLTKEQLSGLRQAEIDQLYASTPNQRGTKQNQTKENDLFEKRNDPKAKRKMRTDDFFDNLEKSLGG